MELMEGSGSPLYALTWKPMDMPAGLPGYRLAASARRTSGSGSGGSRKGWLTPTAATGGKDRGSSAGNDLRNEARLAGWPTPREADGEKNVRMRSR